MTVLKQYNEDTEEWETIVVGKQGPAATIEVGDVTTVGPDDPATVVNSGSVSAAVLDFEIPRGEDGPAGPSPVVNTDGDPGTAIYVGSIDPDGLYTLAVGDVWIEPDA
jgi:hypothetical protein